RLICSRKGHGLELHLMRSKKIREVELCRRALLHADGCAVELKCGIHLQRLSHHEALTVIVIDTGKVEAERSVSRRRPGRIASQDIDLTRLQCGETILGRQGHEFDLLSVV